MEENQIFKKVYTITNYDCNKEKLRRLINEFDLTDNFALLFEAEKVILKLQERNTIGTDDEDTFISWVLTFAKTRNYLYMNNIKSSLRQLLRK